MAKKVENIGIYNALVSQLDKLADTTGKAASAPRNGITKLSNGFAPIWRMSIVCKNWRISAASISPDTALWMQENGKSASTIKTDLAAIRFFHDKMSTPKYQLPSNDELAVELERRCFGGTDRTWSNIEFNKLLMKAYAMDARDYVLALYLARYAGRASTSASALTPPRRNRLCGRMLLPSRARAARYVLSRLRTNGSP